MKKILATLCLVSFMPIITGCSKTAKNISPTYVSPLQYQHYSCDQIRQELLRVNRRVLEVSGQQDNAAGKDAVALGVGLVVFWPALFFMIGGDKKEELARLKGEYEAIESAAIEKECNVAAEIQEARKQKREYEASKLAASENEFVVKEMKYLNERIDYYTGEKCREDMLEAKIVDSSQVNFECTKAANIYEEKLTLLKENPDGYFYKKAIEKKDSSIMSQYHSVESN